MTTPSNAAPSDAAPRRSTLTRLLHNDVRLVLRDKMLVLLLLMVGAVGLAAREALPALDASLRDSGTMPSANVPYAFSSTYPMWVAFIGSWQAALMPGTVFGFLLLDEKEDGSLMAMRVTPLPFERYVGYRLAIPAVLAFGFALVLPSVMGLSAVAWWQRPLLSAGAASTAPLVTLLLASFANDKVQGLAFTKFGGVAGLTILIGWFIPEPWQWLLGVFPPFAIAKAQWMAEQGRAWWWLPLGIGTATQTAMLAPLVRRFQRL